MGGGNLFIKLLKLAKTHQRTQILYKDFISLYPHLKYPPLEQCKDYKEALKYKFHLSYLLGAALIKANKTWYKGGYIKFYFEISRLKEQFAWLKNMQGKVQFENTQSFEYFNKHFNEIKAWIQSAKFKEKYQNHPYPPLLDPDTLDYDNIEASLAWDLNLPLPRRYSFLLMRGHGSGGGAMMSFLRKCKVIVNSNWRKFPNKIYISFYNSLLTNLNSVNVLLYADYKVEQWVADKGYARDKLIALTDKKVPILFQVRDSIGQIKHILGRKWIMSEKTWQTLFYLNDDNILEQIPTIHFTSQSLENQIFLKDVNKFRAIHFIQNSLANAFKHSGEITYLDMSELSKEKAFNTMVKLSQKFGFNAPKEEDRHFFETKKTGGRAIFQILPLTLLARAKDIGVGNEEVKIEISVPKNTTELDLTKEIINFTPLQDFAFYITQEDYEILKNNDKLFKATKNYLKDFAYKLDERIKLEESLMINEKDVLEYLRNNKQARLDLKAILDEELTHLKTHRPDIVASWKYYQEFERMCEEMDK